MIRPIFAAALRPSGAAPRRRRAMTIEPIVSPSGIKAWLVREHAVPLVALSLLVPRRLDPGRSRQVRHRQSHRRHARRGRRRSRRQDLPRAAGEPRHRAVVSGRRAIISAARCARSTRTATRPSTCSGSRSRSRASTPTRSSACAARILADLRRELVNPNSLASRAWWSAAFPGHPYGRESNGTLETVPRITADDMRDYVTRAFARNELTISIVGDIDAEAAGKLIDRAFARACRRTTTSSRCAQATPRGLGRRIVINLDVPQAVVTFGGNGIARSDPDFMAGLHRQSHPGRRQLLLAALPRSARKARAGLRRVRTAWSGSGAPRW